MEYRRLGKTDVFVSAVSLGGHWKRIGEAALGRPFPGAGFSREDFCHIQCPDFMKNRDAVVGRAIDLGINYVDACTGPEVLAYAKVLKERRDRMYLGYSWHTLDSRLSDLLDRNKLLTSLDDGMRQAGLDFVDLWRVSMPFDARRDNQQRLAAEESVAGALESARRQGKARFTGVSMHSPAWLRHVLEAYPDAIQVALFPYPAASRVLERDSLFEAIGRADAGAFGIKPFGGGGLFRGGGSPSGEHAAEDDRCARLAIRRILGNSAIAATLPGCASLHQVENAVRAAAEPRGLETEEEAALEAAAAGMRSRLQAHQGFLRDWECV